MIAAMKAALEALDEAISYISTPAHSPSMARDCKDAIEQLRAAIAQAEKIEPVAYFRHDDYHGWYSTTYTSLEEWAAELEVWKETMNEDDYSTVPPTPLYAHPAPAAQGEPVIPAGTCALWQQSGSDNPELRWVKTKCGQLMNGITLTDWSWNYCPYCGKPIKEDEK